MTNKKISQFIAESSLADSDFIDFIRNGTNYRISYKDVKSSLGAIGALSQIGSPTGVPTLNINGTNYQFRNIESGNGVLASFSPYNGVKLSWNVTQDATGVPLITNVDVAKPVVRSLVAGNGINLGVTGDRIQISAVDAAVSSKTVVVSDISDFPAPVSGVITLNGNTDYLIVQDITTANRFVIAASSTIRASASQIIKLEYTGTGVMFTGVNPNFRMEGITVSCPNGTLFNVTSPTANGVLQMIEMNVEAMANGGTLDGLFICRFSAVAFEAITVDGFKFAGNFKNFIVNTSIQFQVAGTFLDLQSATFDTINIMNCSMNSVGAGCNFLKGATSSANINVGGLGSVTNNRFFGTGNQLVTLTPNDARWYFSRNDEIADTRPDALLCLVNNLTATVITTVNTPVKVTGTWTTERVSFFTGGASGRATYIGEKPLTTPITIASSIVGATGGDKQATTYIAVNGAVINCTKTQATVNSAKAGSFTNIWQIQLQPNDYIELFVENNTDTVDLVVKDAVLRVD